MMNYKIQLLLGQFQYLYIKNTDTRCYISVDKIKKSKNNIHYISIIKFGIIKIDHYPVRTNNLKEFCESMHLKIY